MRTKMATFPIGWDAAKVRKPILPALTTNPERAPTEELPCIAEEFAVGVALGPESNGTFGQLLAAFFNLRNTGRAVKLVIFAVHNSQQHTLKASIQELTQNILWVPDDLSRRSLLQECDVLVSLQDGVPLLVLQAMSARIPRSEEHTSELQSQFHLVCRLL